VLLDKDNILTFIHLISRASRESDNPYVLTCHVILLSWWQHHSVTCHAVTSAVSARQYYSPAAF